MSFSELLLIAIISLLVIGPQRLPETIRFVTLWLGRLRRSIADTKRELEREIGMDDIRRQLHNEEIMRALNADLTTENTENTESTEEKQKTRDKEAQRKDS